MRRLFALWVCVAVFLLAPSAHASTIERTIFYSLGPISGTFGDGQTLNGVGTFFDSDPIVFGLGDTLIVDILFNARLQVFDFGPPTDEYFSFGLNTVSGSPGFSGTWVSSIEALGTLGNVWNGAITMPWQGGGAGFGWGGQGVNITDTQGSFSGIRWTTQLTSANEGVPMTLMGFTGVQMGADGINIIPVAEPGTMCLLGVGLVGLRLRHRAVNRR